MPLSPTSRLPRPRPYPYPYPRPQEQDRDEPPVPAPAVARVLPSFTVSSRKNDIESRRNVTDDYANANANAQGPSTRDKISKFLRGGFGQIDREPHPVSVVVDQVQVQEKEVQPQPQPQAPQVQEIQEPMSKSKQKGSQTDWYLTDAPKLEHGLRRTFNPAATYRELDRRRGVNYNSDEGRVHMSDIKDAVDPRKLLFILRFIVTFGLLLILSGAVFLIHLVNVTVVQESAEYLSFYMDTHLGTMLIMYLGIFHPVVIGLYCLYSGKHLRSVRPFYWRASVTLIIPIVILALVIKMLVHINRNLEPDFHEWMLKYPDSTQSKKMWDLAQTSLRCCGLQGYMDWKHYNKTIPDSCCVDAESCERVPTWRHTGCLALLLQDVNLFTTIYVVIIVLQLVFQVMAIIGMRKFYMMIREFFTSEPTVLQILIGPCSIVRDACSSCFPGRKTSLEFDETHELEHDLLPRDKHGDLKFKATFPWKA